MAGERGSYRAIAVVLLDGKDFHRLPERARWVFVALKMNLGPAGIEVHYPEALAHQLAAQTGAPADGVRESLDLLEQDGWIRREGNVLWILEQLEFDPHMSEKDKNHRKSIQRHVASLPRLAIVDAFVRRYEHWFTDDDGRPIGRATEGPAKAPATTEDREPRTDDRIPKTETDAREADATSVVRAANEGMKSNPEIGERFNPIQASGGGREIVKEWLAAGVRPTTAVRVCRETALNYKPKARHRQISSMSYFTSAVLEAHEREQIDGSGSGTGESGSGDGTVGKGGRPSKYGHLVVHSAGDDAASA